MALLEVSCAIFLAKETLYLRSATDRASQDDVRRQLGRPMLTDSTKTGEAVWVYQVREHEKGGNNAWTNKGSWCDEYVLTFDKQGILRRWTHQSEKHRFEDWPTYCVTDGFTRLRRKGPRL